MSKRPCASDHSYEYAGKAMTVSCELAHGHDGKHAAWTWETPPYPRVEWTAAFVPARELTDTQRLAFLENEISEACGGAIYCDEGNWFARGEGTEDDPDWEGEDLRQAIDEAIARRTRSGQPHNSKETP